MAIIRLIIAFAAVILIGVVIGVFFGFAALPELNYIFAAILAIGFAIGMWAIFKIIEPPAVRKNLLLIGIVVTIGIAIFTAYDSISSEVRSWSVKSAVSTSPGEKRKPGRLPRKATHEDIVKFMSEVLDVPDIEVTPLNYLRTYAGVGQYVQVGKRRYREIVHRKGLWAWIAWLVSLTFIPVAGVFTLSLAKDDNPASSDDE
ncbi:MAG: hypothetical protein BMS9Abin26_0351 [Gammaproteobacteria bacterium]|nr:MAG: hypothetical protein BMS9Abin26_0351 [Gammaproteobacteria bacterium]